MVAWNIKSSSGQRFSCVDPRMGRFPLDRPRAVKRRCSLEVDYGEFVEFVVAGENLFNFVI